MGLFRKKKRFTEDEMQSIERYFSMLNTDSERYMNELDSASSQQENDELYEKTMQTYNSMESLLMKVFSSRWQKRKVLREINSLRDAVQQIYFRNCIKFTEA